MHFIDETQIEVYGGHGGKGCSSFRREKFIPFGGPNGGDGGKGGSVILKADAQLNTLADLKMKSIFKAKNGDPGRSAQCTGACGQDLYLSVPLGTVVYEESHFFGELLEDGDQLCVATGGDGGFGNVHFKTSTNRTPRRAEPGRPGVYRVLKLELKVMADVGLLGLPNVGKSSLLRSISAATPKVADYPFTTLTPQLGVVSSSYRSIVVADVPGLLEGASEGVGLGIRFLKHLERTHLLLHVIDMSSGDVHAMIHAYHVVQKEIQSTAVLAQKPQWMVFNKSDCLSPEEAAQCVRQWTKRTKWGHRPIFIVSSEMRWGLEPLINAMMQYHSSS